MSCKSIRLEDGGHIEDIVRENKNKTPKGKERKIKVLSLNFASLLCVLEEVENTIFDQNQVRRFIRLGIVLGLNTGPLYYVHCVVRVALNVSLFPLVFVPARVVRRK